VATLILLVGTNPLPNFVVGEYYKNEYDKLILICSEKTTKQGGTKKFADRLRELLGFDLSNSQIISIEDVGDPKKIREALKENLKLENGFHLNYTGGTKAMAVHVYNFLDKEVGKKLQKATYLDGRKFKIVDYDENEEKTKMEPLNEEDLRDRIRIDIRTLLKLHHYDDDNKIKFETWSDCKFKDTLKIIEEEVIKKGRLDEFLDWCDNPFRIIFKDDRGDFFNKVENFRRHIEKNKVVKSIRNFQNDTPDYIWKILDSFPEKLIQNRDIYRPEKKESNKQFKKRIIHSVKFFDGKWLEWYVYDKIREQLKEKGIGEGTQFGISLKASKIGSRPFELDIFIIRGYQLFGISITTSRDKHICKSKGFEVIHRVEQIGGMESKAIVIYARDKNEAEELQKDLSFGYGTPEDKFEVFCKDDFRNIENKIIQNVFRP